MKISLRILAIALVLVFMAGIRVVKIENDPPHSLNLWQGYEFNDEGYKILAARNKALFGDWKWSQDDSYKSWMTISPLGVRLYYLVFSLFEFGIAQARYLNVFFGMLTLPFFYGFLSRIGDRRTALVATVFLGLNYQFIMYNRLALLETFLTFFIVVALYLAFVDWKGARNVPRVLLCTIAFVCGFLVKPSILVFGIAILPGVAAVYWKTIWAARSKLKPVPILATLVVLAVAYWFGSQQVMSAVSMVIVKVTHNWSPIYFASNYIVEHFVRQPVLTLSVLLYSYYYLVNYRETVREHPVDLIMISWVFCSYLVLTSLDFNPLRYYVQILPAECYLAARGITLLASGRLSLPRLSWQAMALAGIFIFFELSTVFAGIFQLLLGNLNFGSEPGLSYTGNVILSSGASLIFTSIMVIWLFKRFRHNQKMDFIVFSGRRWAVSLIVLVLSVNLAQYLSWYTNSQPSIVTYSRDLANITGDVIVGGEDAPILCVANRLKCLKIFSNVNDADEVLKIAPAYIVFRKDTAFIEEFTRRHPRLMRHATYVTTYRLGSGLFTRDEEVYRINYGRDEGRDG